MAPALVVEGPRPRWRQTARFAPDSLWLFMRQIQPGCLRGALLNIGE